MLILTVRTDKPEAEIGLYGNNDQLAYDTWLAHRELAETLHVRMKQLLESCGKDWQDLQGIVCFKGPGSFTGLRIGLSVANALAYSYSLPIIASEGGSWIAGGIQQIVDGKTDGMALPEYGAAAHITAPRK